MADSRRADEAPGLAARRIATGFGFLDRTAGIPIGESLIDYDPAIHTYGRALWIGVLNTLKVSVVGIILATVIGTMLGSLSGFLGRWVAAVIMRTMDMFYAFPAVLLAIAGMVMGFLGSWVVSSGLHLGALGDGRLGLTKNKK